MLKTEYGDLLTNKTGVLVHGVNCQGVMNSGIARQIRETYPIVFNEYRARHVKEGTALGSTQFVHVNNNETTPLIIVNAATQNFYGRDPKVIYADYTAIKSCFVQINEMLLGYEQEVGDKLQLHFPAIGAGLANGKWDVISDIIDKSIDDRFEKTLWLYK